MLRDLLIVVDTHHQIIPQSFGLPQRIRMSEMHHVVAVINNIMFLINSSVILCLFSIKRGQLTQSYIRRKIDINTKHSQVHAYLLNQCLIEIKLIFVSAVQHKQYSRDL